MIDHRRGLYQQPTLLSFTATALDHWHDPCVTPIEQRSLLVPRLVAISSAASRAASLRVRPRPPARVSAGYHRHGRWCRFVSTDRCVQEIVPLTSVTVEVHPLERIAEGTRICHRGISAVDLSLQRGRRRIVRARHTTTSNAADSRGTESHRCALPSEYLNAFAGKERQRHHRRPGQLVGRVTLIEYPPVRRSH